MTYQLNMNTKRSYGQYCPIAITSEILCNRWTSLVLRSFFLGATRFSDIHKSVPLMSSALLATRLKELERAGIITRHAKANTNVEYQLTKAGDALFPILDQMGQWAQNWLRREITTDENLDPDILMWELRQLSLAAPAQQAKRRVAKFQLSGVTTTKRNYWLVFDTAETEICVKDPGYDVDIWITAHIKILVEIWLGHCTIDRMIDSGQLVLDGAPSEIKNFPNWFSLSHFGKTAKEPQI